MIFNWLIFSEIEILDTNGSYISESDKIRASPTSAYDKE